MSNPTKDQTWTNRTWSTIENLIKKSMEKVIPTKDIYTSNVNKTGKIKTDTFKTKKWLLRIHRMVKQRKLYEIGYGKKLKFIEYLEKTNEKYKFSNFDLPKFVNAIKYNKYEELDTSIKLLIKILQVKIDIEDRANTLAQIEEAVEKRIEMMETNKKLMLNSLLDRDIKKIKIDRLLIKDQNNQQTLILSEKEILQETKKHFKSITDEIVTRDNNLE